MINVDSVDLLFVYWCVLVVCICVVFVVDFELVGVVIIYGINMFEEIVWLL